jgi:hypothetical protein
VNWTFCCRIGVTQVILFRWGHWAGGISQQYRDNHIEQQEYSRKTTDEFVTRRRSRLIARRFIWRHDPRLDEERNLENVQ